MGEERNKANQKQNKIRNTFILKNEKKNFFLKIE